MYQIIGTRKILSYMGLASVLVGFLWFLKFPTGDLWGVLRIASGAVSVVGLLLVIFGQTGIFPFICRLPIARNFFPDIDGVWDAKLESNWPTIAKAHKLEIPKSAITKAKIKITSRLFRVRLELDSNNKYSESDTVAVSVLKNQEHGDVSLHYIYENRTPKAVETDSSTHFGAASLKIKKNDVGETYLEGDYWTNRNWIQGLNTAGRIALIRKM